MVLAFSLPGSTGFTLLRFLLLIIHRPLQSNVSGVSVGNAGKPGSSPELHASPKVKLMATSLRKLDKSPIPTGASEWKKSALDVLNVHYERRDVFDFDFDDLTIPSNVQEGKINSFLEGLILHRYRHNRYRIRACQQVQFYYTRF